MQADELLLFVAKVLDELRVPYLVTGSMATIYFGEPRYTDDIDIVAQLRTEHVPRFCAAFPDPDFYISAEAVTEAIEGKGQFNIIHPVSGLKVDVMVPNDSPFNHSRFFRAVRLTPAPGQEASFSSPEDVILKKLEFYKEGGSEKHLRDITGVLRISGQRLDYRYIADWAARLGVTDIWSAVLAKTSLSENDTK